MHYNISMNCCYWILHKKMVCVQVAVVFLVSKCTKKHNSVPQVPLLKVIWGAACFSGNRRVSVGTASHFLSVIREFKHHQRLPVFPWPRNFTLIVYYWLVPGMYLSIVCLILEYFVIISISENGIFYFHNGLIGYIVYFRVYRVFRVYCVF